MRQLGVSDIDICKIGGWKNTEMLLRYGNNSLEYLRGITNLHPILQNKISWSSRADRLKKYALQMFDPQKNDIQLTVSEGNELVIKITSRV